MNFIISLLFLVSFFGVYGIGGLFLLIPISNEASDELGIIIFLIYLGVGYYLYKLMFKILDNIEKRLKQQKYNLKDNSQITKIIRDYGSLMVEIDDAGVAIYDESFLPYGKVEIKEALIKGYKLTNNEDQKNALLVSMENLGWFQKNIGKVPLRGFPDYSNMSADEIIQSSKEIDNDSNINKEKYEEMSLKAEKEYADILKLL